MTRGRKKKTRTKGNGSKDPSVKTSVHGIELEGPVVVDGMKHFSKADMATLELAQFKYVNAEQAARLKQHENDDYQRKANEKLAQMQIKKKRLDDLAAERKSELIKLQAAIQSVYEVDLGKITYDDETGRITEPPPDAVESQPAA